MFHVNGICSSWPANIVSKTFVALETSQLRSLRAGEQHWRKAAQQLEKKFGDRIITYLPARQYAHSHATYFLKLEALQRLGSKRHTRPRWCGCYELRCKELVVSPVISVLGLRGTGEAVCAIQHGKRRLLFYMRGTPYKLDYGPLKSCWTEL